MQKVASSITRGIYRIPFVGFQFRKFLERRLGERDYHQRSYWNESLSGWAASYLGGTFSNELRDSVTVLMARRLAPAATSLLDLGCAGGTLAVNLAPPFKSYHGVDISDVAVAKATGYLSANLRPSLSYELTVSQIQDFKSAKQFDVIVFNEVLYYLPIEQLPQVIRQYTAMLAPEGLIVVSLKSHELSHFIQTILMRELNLDHGVLYQQQPEAAGWKTTRNSKTPAYLVQAFRPKMG